MPLSPACYAYSLFHHSPPPIARQSLPRGSRAAVSAAFDCAFLAQRLRALPALGIISDTLSNTVSDDVVAPLEAYVAAATHPGAEAAGVPGGDPIPGGGGAGRPPAAAPSAPAATSSVAPAAAAASAAAVGAAPTLDASLEEASSAEAPTHPAAA